MRLQERDHLEDLGVGGIIILNCILKKQEGMGVWINLAQNTDKWQAAVTVVMHLWFP
jgi:hypothetical protein